MLFFYMFFFYAMLRARARGSVNQARKHGARATGAKT
jgi:hypothetical protein